MAQHKVLNIPPPMVDPVYRHVVALSSNLHVLAYNNKLIPPEKVPVKWEDLLRPEFKGKKFASDIRPVGVAALVPAWGLEKTLDFARKIAAQQPFWGRGHSIVISSVQSGEIPMFIGTNFGAVKRAQTKDRLKVLGYKFLEPVVGRLHLTDGVLAAARNPYAALLWLEFQASPEGQKLLDEHWPYGASVLLPDSVQAQETKGKTLPWSIGTTTLNSTSTPQRLRGLTAFQRPKSNKSGIDSDNYLELSGATVGLEAVFHSGARSIAW
jgi:ABC-type Fe3+ transport system substrate-binding protein